MTISYPIYTPFPALIQKAQNLADEFNLSLTETPESYPYVLYLTPEFLGLKKTKDRATPFYLDFASLKMIYRLQRASPKTETLARAFGIKNIKQHPVIVDATAGFARDSFILASLGCQVTLLEKSNIVCALVKDALERGALNPTLAPILQRMELINADAITWLTQHPAQFIYLDPMFPERKKKALVKKEMRLLQDIVDTSTLGDEALLSTALACGAERVVVKRPRLSATLNHNRQPEFSMVGSSSRFDVYLTLKD